jgi:hypothetical protein
MTTWRWDVSQTHVDRREHLQKWRPDCMRPVHRLLRALMVAILVFPSNGVPATVVLVRPPRHRDVKHCSCNEETTATSTYNTRPVFRRHGSLSAVSEWAITGTQRAEPEHGAGGHVVCGLRFAGSGANLGDACRMTKC